MSLNSLKKVLLPLFLISIVSQLGKHFWPDWSLVLGIRIDYLSPVLYLIDLIWLALVGIEIKNNFKTKKFKERIKSIYLNKGCWAFLVLVIVNVVLAENSRVAVYGWLRFSQFLITLWLIRNNKKTIEKLLLLIIPWWLIGESLLALGQIAKGGSLGGIWWWLGERTFNFNTIGIAQMSVVGQGLIRAYGTFSHPNSLAGFLLVALLWWWKLKEKVKSKTWWWSVSWLALMGIILTGSRIIWFLTFLSIIFFLKSFIKEKRKLLFGSGIVLLLVIFVLALVNYNYPLSNFLGGWDENGLLKRGELNIAATRMIIDKPLFGVGMKNFLVELPSFQEESQIFWLQPVHNILLLILAQLGWIISLVSVYITHRLFRGRKILKWQLLILGVIIATGMMDHYWLTLVQNRWLLILFLGMI